MLFDPTRHEALCATPWSEGVARLAISEIVADTLAHFGPQTLWPAHPRDADLGDATLPAAALYHGAAGVIWALERLQTHGGFNLEVQRSRRSGWVRCESILLTRPTSPSCQNELHTSHPRRTLPAIRMQLRFRAHLEVTLMMSPHLTVALGQGCRSGQEIFLREGWISLSRMRETQLNSWCFSSRCSMPPLRAWRFEY